MTSLATIASNLRTLPRARADRAATDLRLITGDTFPALVNVYRYIGPGNENATKASDLFAGRYAQSSAFEDAKDVRGDAASGGKLDYEATFQLNTDGTWKLVDLLRRA